ncbi:hypothetical protein EV182_004135 [Spiromyces aspiralis]|uniref:Uncharacterized protein n=1 Tax=Spiromyces aspiralis TaxID=68401 RepID=A0ACC1HRK9_9FUNG|nr:hypothetical protein EV182_004135 [Spiromyces aspiralis]
MSRVGFAEAQLAKYGWERGKGLGKNNEGIKRAVTVALKDDLKGIGVDSSQWDSAWWDNIYNKASENVRTANTNRSRIPESQVDEDVPAKNYRAPDRFSINNPGSLYHGMFVKSSAMSSTAAAADSSNAEGRDKMRKSENGTKASAIRSITVMTDEELFAACEGRTARKGARGEQPGKLKRVSGDGIPRPEVVAMIEAAIRGDYCKAGSEGARLSSADDASKRKGKGKSKKRKDRSSSHDADEKKKTKKKRRRDTSPSKDERSKKKKSSSSSSSSKRNDK